jgi:hypothetical protein
LAAHSLDRPERPSWRPVLEGQAVTFAQRIDSQPLPPWLALIWLLGVGGLGAIRDPNAPRPTWPQKLWALAWAWVLFGGFFLLVTWLGVSLVWFVVRLCLIALATVLTLGYVLSRLWRHPAS